MHTSRGLGIGQVFTTATLGPVPGPPPQQINHLHHEKSSNPGRIRQVGLTLRCGPPFAARRVVVWTLARAAPPPAGKRGGFCSPVALPTAAKSCLAAPQNRHPCSAPHGARLPQCPRLHSTPLHSATHQKHATLHSATLRSGSGTDGRLATTPGSQARRSHSQPHLTVPCHPSPTNCWLLYVCPPTLLRPQRQSALCAKPGPGIPCHPASRFRALRTRQEVATPREPNGHAPSDAGWLGSAQSPPRLTHAQSPHGLTPADASPLLASETLSSSLAYAASRSCAGPQCQSALRAKPSPGFPCYPSKPVLGIVRKAEHRDPRDPLECAPANSTALREWLA